MTLFQRIQEKTVHIRHQIQTHPFVTLIHADALAEHLFDFYAEQDELYIVDLITVLEKIADGLAKRPEMMQAGQLIKARAQLLKQEVDAGFFNPKRTPGLFQPVSKQIEKITVIEEYTSHLKRAVNSGSVTVALAAIISCYNSYREIGDHARFSPISAEHRYKSWIEVNYDPEFVAFGQTLIAIAEQVMTLELQDGTLTDINLAIDAGAISYQYEYGLFDAAFKGRPQLQSTSSLEYSL